jgi:hypothetical protein
MDIFMAAIRAARLKFDIFVYANQSSLGHPVVTGLGPFSIGFKQKVIPCPQLSLHWAGLCGSMANAVGGGKDYGINIWVMCPSKLVLVRCGDGLGEPRPFIADVGNFVFGLLRLATPPKTGLLFCPFPSGAIVAEDVGVILDVRVKMENS